MVSPPKLYNMYMYFIYIHINACIFAQPHIEGDREGGSDERGWEDTQVQIKQVSKMLTIGVKTMAILVLNTFSVSLKLLSTEKFLKIKLYILLHDMYFKNMEIEISPVPKNSRQTLGINCGSQAYVPCISCGFLLSLGLSLGNMPLGQRQLWFKFSRQTCFVWPF